MSAPTPRSRWRYAAAGLLCLAGIATFVFFLSRALTALDGGLQQMLAPGSSQFRLPTPGRQMIYYEYETVFNGVVYYRHETAPQMALRVVNAATGAEVPVTEIPPKERFTFRNRHGLSMWTFDTEAAGDYAVSVTMPPRMPFPRVVLSVGQRQTTGQMAAGLARKMLPALLLSVFLIGSAFTVASPRRLVRRGIVGRNPRVAS